MSNKNLHVRGYKEESVTSTPFDMSVMNDIDRFHLVGDVIDRLPQLGARAAYFKQAIQDKLIEHREYIERHGDDMPAISGWRWGTNAFGKRVTSTGASRFTGTASWPSRSALRSLWMPSRTTSPSRVESAVSAYPSAAPLTRSCRRGPSASRAS